MTNQTHDQAPKTFAKIAAPKRTQDGLAVIDHLDFNVVPADAVALLSGVNFATVERVLAALHVIQNFSGVESWRLIDFEAVPTARVRPDEPGFGVRAFNTAAFCHDLVSCGRFKSYQYVLPRLDKSFEF